ncbi:hypothetical protein GCM10010350_02210 [Streptomyces galilaeus]|nr:hypothetical protein GCM10010350_02210 [Streptomyces galilaeus]
MPPVCRTADTRLAFERATEGTEGSERALGAMTDAYARLGAMTDAYARLISARPETLLMQMRLPESGSNPNERFGRRSCWKTRPISACLPHRAGRSQWAR